MPRKNPARASWSWSTIPVHPHEYSCGATQASTASAGPNLGNSFAGRARREVNPSNLSPLPRTPRSNIRCPTNGSSFPLATSVVARPPPSSKCQEATRPFVLENEVTGAVKRTSARSSDFRQVFVFISNCLQGICFWPEAPATAVGPELRTCFSLNGGGFCLDHAPDDVRSGLRACPATVLPASAI